MSDIVKRLRLLHDSRQEVTTCKTPTIFGEAADIIDELEILHGRETARADAAVKLRQEDLLFWQEQCRLREEALKVVEEMLLAELMQHWRTSHEIIY